eukprot:6458116-Amphidinium_carterae.2
MALTTMTATASLRRFPRCRNDECILTSALVNHCRINMAQNEHNGSQLVYVSNRVPTALSM